MTTHDPQTEMAEAQEPTSAEAPSGTEAAAGTDSAEPADQVLFAGSDLSGLRSRWTAVQSAFVDDPRVCVQEANGLVADVVEKLTTGFGEVRARLEQQWDRGEEVSTEDLRIALTRYREFFDRLIAI